VHLQLYRLVKLCVAARIWSSAPVLSHDLLSHPLAYACERQILQAVPPVYSTTLSAAAEFRVVSRQLYAGARRLIELLGSRIIHCDSTTLFLEHTLRLLAKSKKARVDLRLVGL